jgi:hypothetical protein
MTYTSERPPIAHSREQLAATIPGWGVDLDPNDRPSVPREQDARPTSAQWDIPEQQVEDWPRERSIEHQRLTPVFGTACPPHLLSGVLRQHAYRRYSEARAAHWLILLYADRVDAIEQHLRSFLSLRPDNPLTQSGVASELSHHPIASRRGTKRVDLSHQWIDPIIVAGPWLAAGVGIYATLRAIGKGTRRVGELAAVREVVVLARRRVVERPNFPPNRRRQCESS